MVSAKELLAQDDFEIKFRAGGQYTPVRVTVKSGRMFFWFDYFPDLITEIKESFEGRRYHGFENTKAPLDTPAKVWSAPITQRNLFQFDALLGKYGPNPYANWEQPKIPEEEIFKYIENRPWGALFRPNTDANCFKCNKPKDNCTCSKFHPSTLFQHQVDMIAHLYSAHLAYWGVEMRLGKTLSAMLTIEMLREVWNLTLGDIVWVGPRSAIAGAKVDFRKWNSPLVPDFQTYNGLIKTVETWEGDKPPRVLVLDEISRCKTPSTQRSGAAQICADAMRECYGLDCLIVGMSGSPAPKSPADWWKPCEIIQPGYIREQNWYVFRERVGIVIEQPSEVAGAGSFKKVVGWKDSDEKCKLCNKPETDPTHNSELAFLNLQSDVQPHKFVKGVNEVANIGRRLEGLVLTRYKKDCLDLPHKQYETFHLEPSGELLRAAQVVVASTARGSDALIKLRTLSDGFLYKEEPTGKKIPCPDCDSGRQKEYFDKNDPDRYLTTLEVAEGCRFIYEECPEDEDIHEFVPKILEKIPIELAVRLIDCYTCNGAAEVDQMHRVLSEVPCPKDDLLIDLLEMHEEVGRFNVYAGFQGSLDRIQRVAHKQGWHTFKADGRGWKWITHQEEVIEMTDDEMLVAFESNREDWEKVLFTGQPGAAGMGIDLAASPGTFFYSNDFNPESRTQAEERAHSLNMDRARGGWIYDVIHLPSDQKVLTSIKESRNLEMMSMEYLRSLYVDAA